LKPETIIDSLSFQVTNLKLYSMIKNLTIILISIFTNIIIGNAQDFTASISGKQNAIVLTPDNDYKNGFKCGESKIAFNGIIYNTVFFKGKCWLDRNLGAKSVAKYPKDKESFGDYYQWGRVADGHEEKRSTPTVLLSEIDNPGFSGFILSTTSPYDWHNPQNNNLWLNDSNSPCPNGWNVASKNDFDDLLSNSNSSNDLFNSQLRIPVSGYRNGSSGNILDEGNRTLLWTSNSSGKKAIALEAENNQIKQKKFARANGMPVRCVKSE
jgi:uncharacterized protein (TIGR02145 family)